MALDRRQLYTDFRQRYEHTYIRVKFPNAQYKSIFYVDAISIADKLPVLTIHNEDVGVIKLNYDTEADLFFDSPAAGYFFHDGKVALYFSRTCSRQWKRGIATGNTRIGSPYANYFTLPCAQLSESPLASAFKGVVYHFSEAITLLKAQKALSVPISPHLAVGLNVTDSTTYILWFGYIPIGEVMSEGNIIRLHERHFEQEVIDYCNKANIRVQII